METTSRSENGGYYAIKGFTYQFDKSLLEVFSNPDSSIQIEQVQDLAVDEYYIQVKYKEAKTYSGSKIKPAIIQLIKLFQLDNTKKFVLYCYFKDKAPQENQLTEEELDSILGTSATEYSLVDKRSFLQSFELHFSEDFQSQFKQLLTQMKNSLNLKNDEEAAVHHAILRSHLIDIAIKKKVSERSIDLSKVKEMVTRSEKIVFERAYWKYLNQEKYLRYIREEYFRFKGVNIPDRERLFVIEVDSSIKDVDLVSVIRNIQKKYFKMNSSPAPYVALVGVDSVRQASLKRRLWDEGLCFSDGTYFDGDKFRVKDLLAKQISARIPTFKMLNTDTLKDVIRSSLILEIFVFAGAGPREKINLKGREFKEFFISQTKDIIKIIN